MPNWSQSRWLKLLVADLLALGSLAIVLVTTLVPGGHAQHQLNLVPAAELLGDLRDGSLSNFMVDSFGNIALFMPFGLFVPLAVQRLRDLGRITLYGGLLSLAVETAQYVLPIGRYASITDVILNTIGTAAGYITLRLLAWLLTP